MITLLSFTQSSALLTQPGQLVYWLLSCLLFFAATSFLGALWIWYATSSRREYYKRLRQAHEQGEMLTPPRPGKTIRVWRGQERETIVYPSRE